MQIQINDSTASPILAQIINNQNVVLLTIFISFLDDQQVAVLAQGALTSRREEKFYKIIVAKHFMGNYLNKVDRSLFFLFYQHPLFAAIERNNTNAIASTLHPYLVHAQTRFQRLLQLLRTHTLFLTLQDALQETVQAVFFNPDLPLPRMKRETIAMFASTPLQQHLALLSVCEEEEEEWVQEAVMELREQVQREVQERAEKQWTAAQRLAFETVRFKGYLITYGEVDSFLLEGFRTHNLVVVLLGLCSQVAQTYLTILDSIEDPMMRFTEFLLRATLYRNIVLALQEKFSFLNAAYSKLYSQQYHSPPAIPPFSIWRAALSMWLQGTESLHKRNEKIYCYVMAKLRENNLLIHLAQRSEKMPTFYGQLKDALELQEFSEEAKIEAYSLSGEELQLQGFFKDNLEMYEIVAKDYHDYFLDLSLNQFTVHWCGHSQQKIKAPHFAAHAQLLISQSLRLFRFLRQKVEASFPAELRLSVLREMLREDLQFQLQKITCPAVLRVIVEALNQQIRMFVATQGGIFGEEALSKYLLHWDFTEKDDLIAYFAGKAEISPDCPSSLSFYYDLQYDPTALPTKIQNFNPSESSSEGDVYESAEEEL